MDDRMVYSNHCLITHGSSYRHSYFYPWETRSRAGITNSSVQKMIPDLASTKGGSGSSVGCYEWQSLENVYVVPSSPDLKDSSVVHEDIEILLLILLHASSFVSVF